MTMTASRPRASGGVHDGDASVVGCPDPRVADLEPALARRVHYHVQFAGLMR